MNRYLNVLIIWIYLDLAYKNHYLVLKVSFCSKHYSKGAWCGVQEALRELV